MARTFEIDAGTDFSVGDLIAAVGPQAAARVITEWSAAAVHGDDRDPILTGKRVDSARSSPRRYSMPRLRLGQIWLLPVSNPWLTARIARFGWQWRRTCRWQCARGRLSERSASWRHWRPTRVPWFENGPSSAWLSRCTPRERADTPWSVRLSMTPHPPSGARHARVSLSSPGPPPATPCATFRAWPRPTIADGGRAQRGTVLRRLPASEPALAATTPGIVAVMATTGCHDRVAVPEVRS
jgi:hypothetical protein